ncbi:MAG: hypothetical protein ABI370_04855 [Gammaproteobacteria bacterium]
MQRSEMKREWNENVMKMRVKESDINAAVCGWTWTIKISVACSNGFVFLRATLIFCALDLVTLRIVL